MINTCAVDLAGDLGGLCDDDAVGHADPLNDEIGTNQRLRVA